MGRPEVMRQFLKLIMSKPQINSLDLDTLTITKADYIDDILKETFSDVVYKIRKKDGVETQICLLFEHKSTPEKIAPIKTLRFEENTPDFKHLFIDVKEADKLIDATTDPEIRVYFKATRIANSNKIEKATKLFFEILDIFDEPGWKTNTLNKRFFQITLLYLVKVSALAREKNIFDIVQEEKPERSEEIMSLYDTIQNEERVKTLTEILEAKFEKPKPEDIKKFLNSADRKQLLQLTNGIFEISSFDEVREMLED